MDDKTTRKLGLFEAIKEVLDEQHVKYLDNKETLTIEKS
jgi:hypothetical protein